jgi:hypothetical protein
VISEINVGSGKLAAQLADPVGLQAMFFGKDQEQGLIRQHVVEEAAEESWIAGGGANRIQSEA